MSPWNPTQWTEQYLVSLIGQPESGRLEFKSGKALARKEDKDRFTRDHLSPAVSAFANSEGGIIVIGMDEDRNSKPRVASQLDGIGIATGNAIESPEQFQQMVDSCISPFLPGLAVRRIPLSGQLQGRFALIVHVPQGSTAYQSRDHLYYSRSEFETKSMPDHEVRLRMMRGRSACLGLEAVYCMPSRPQVMERMRAMASIASMKGDANCQGSISEAVEDLMKMQLGGGQHVSFRLRLRNIGEITIHDLALHVACISKSGATVRFRSMAVDDKGHKFRLPREVQASAGECREPPPKIFPGDHIDFPDGAWTVHLPYGGSIDDSALSVHWKAFLEDAIPCEGAVDVLEGYRQAMEELTRQPTPEEWQG